MLLVKSLGIQPYAKTWQAMQDYTNQRGPSTPDQLWLLEHPPVFTLGQAGKPEHLLNPGDIPIVNSDRGGQVTYHGPGQLIA
ncbi:MAG: octanoyltransferase, partial [Candidatus Thiodiazotropha sp. 6PLUC10]